MEIWAKTETELTVAEFAESVQDIAEAVVHWRQRLQLDLLKVFGTLVLQVTISLADAANDGRRLKGEGRDVLWFSPINRRSRRGHQSVDVSCCCYANLPNERSHYMLVCT